MQYNPQDAFRLRSCEEIAQTWHINLTAGVIAGLLTALGGAVKDAPYEGFKPATFMRSILVGAGTGLASSLVTGNFYVALAVSGYLERVMVEGFKILRQRKPGKFLTPQDLNFTPPIVANREHLAPPAGTVLSKVSALLPR